jgi:dephospho-CoA kinase
VRLVCGGVSRVLRCGLTGGVASGKSTVARLLAARGAAVRDADRVVAELYATPGGASLVRRLFGEGVIGSDGEVDRRALGRVVLHDREARERLEVAVHPLVRAALSDWLTELESAPGAPEVAVVEAALLVETGSYREHDRLIVVIAPLVQRRERAMASGWSAEKFDRLAAAQLDDAARAAVADYVVDNSSDLPALEARACELWSRLLEDAAARQAGKPLERRQLR